MEGDDSNLCLPLHAEVLCSMETVINFIDSRNKQYAAVIEIVMYSYLMFCELVASLLTADRPEYAVRSDTTKKIRFVWIKVNKSKDRIIIFIIIVERNKTKKLEWVKINVYM